MSTVTSPDSKSSEPKRDSWGKSIANFAVVMVFIVAAKAAIAEPFYVPSGSMEPTLLIGDELLATKFPYGYSSASLPSFFTLPQTSRWLGALPERGDIIVFRWPGDRSQNWVKRVIGLPGDRVAVRGGQVWINGEAAPLRPDGTGELETDNGSRVAASRFIETLPGHHDHLIFKLSANAPYDNMAEIVVPEGHLFVMGDNRDNSADSRVPLRDGGVGLLPVDDLVGRADALVGSWDLAVAHQPLWRWPSGLRLTRFFSALH